MERVMQTQIMSGVADWVAKAKNERSAARLNMREADRFFTNEDWDAFETSISWANMHWGRAHTYLREARKLKAVLAEFQHEDRAPVEMRKAG